MFNLRTTTLMQVSDRLDEMEKSGVLVYKSKNPSNKGKSTMWYIWYPDGNIGEYCEFQSAFRAADFFHNMHFDPVPKGNLSKKWRYSGECRHPRSSDSYQSLDRKGNPSYVVVRSICSLGIASPFGGRRQIVLPVKRTKLKTGLANEDKKLLQELLRNHADGIRLTPTKRLLLRKIAGKEICSKIKSR